MTVAIELREVTKTFGSVRAVGPISFAVEPGEFVSLLGPSGCGKTTTLRMIAGFERPTAGGVLLDGRRVNDLPPERRQVGIVFQNYALFPHLTVFDNIAFGLRVRKEPRAAIEAKVAAILELVGLPALHRRFPSQLSGGQQQRVALARALVLEPRVLLLDEPLSNLDFKLRLEMRAELKRIAERVGFTALYVTHDQGEALTMSDRIFVMRDGWIEQAGAPREIYERPATLFVADFIGGANFLAGRVEAVPGSAHVRLRTDAGPVLCAVGGAPTASPGAPASAVIRPEKVHLLVAPPAEAPNVFPAEVEQTLYAGDVVRLILTSAISARLHVSRPASADLLAIRRGQQVWVELPPEDIVLLGSPGAAA